MQHDSARPHVIVIVKKFLEMSKYEALLHSAWFSRYCFYRSRVWVFWRNQRTGQWLDRVRRKINYLKKILKNYLKDGKNGDKYFIFFFFSINKFFLYTKIKNKKTDRFQFYSFLCIFFPQNKVNAIISYWQYWPLDCCILLTKYIFIR